MSKLKWEKKILLILLILQTSAFLEAKTIQINANQRAPYSGVLVSEDSYSDMWIEIAQGDIQKTELQKCLDDKEFYEPNYTTAGGSGFVAGLLTAIIVIHFSR